MSDILSRFLKYVNICTASDEEADTFPSSPFQLAFGEALTEECISIGLEDARMDSHGYVTACLSPNTDKATPAICFIAHMDTSPEASGLNVRPVITENYDGGIIHLDGIDLDPDEFPDLKNYTGSTIISAGGKTLLGADDKAGIAEIMTAMEYIINNDVPHGFIRVLFTPDEEIGRGVDYLDAASLGCDFGYTMDGGAIGELEYENFNAASAEIIIKGKSIHPGTAKGIMKNAALIASDFATLMPSDETPSATEGYEGFYHLCDIKGGVSEARLHYIIRDFDAESFESRKRFITSLAEKVGEKYGVSVECTIEEQYRNMREIIEQHKETVELAKDAMLDCGIVPKIQPIRGGTDGARLSFMGLPCPNIFAGGHNFHGPYEFVPLESMEKASELIVKIVEKAVGRKA